MYINELINQYNLSGSLKGGVKAYDRVATDLYVDKPLTNVSIAYKNNDMIGDLALPKIQVSQETGVIWKYGKENFVIRDMQRGAKSRSKQTSYSVDTDTTYRITNYAISDIVTKNMRDMAESPMQPESDTTEFLTDLLMLNKEYQVASILFNTGSTGFSGYTEALNNASSRYQWDDYTNSNPIDDVDYAKITKIAASSGNTSDFAMVVGHDVWLQLKNHPDILERIKYSQKGIITEQLVAEIMGLDNLYVGKALYNSANEGQTATLANVWGKYALVYHKGKPSIKTSATAALIHGGMAVRKWTDNYLRGATVIETEEALQAKILSAESGYLFSTAVA